MIPVNIPDITEDDISAVGQVLRGGWVSGEAPIVVEFEKAFADFHGREHGISVPNGSIAIDLVISTLEIGPGDEVILPSFTIISCLSEILRRGATPVFVDADPLTWNIDTEKIEALISDRTRAIMVVHTYGLPVDMDPVLKISQKFNIPIIEDSAEAHGLMYKDRICGSMGYASTFSFYANKNITTGEGGIILTDDPVFAERLRYFRNLTFSAEKRFVHEDLGWNFRFTGLQAALGLSQLSRISEVIERRRYMAAEYIGALSKIPGVNFQPQVTQYATNNFWVVGALLDEAYFPEAKEVASSLAGAGVQSRPFFYPLHLQPVYLKTIQDDVLKLPVAERLGRQGIYFPNGLGMSTDMLMDSVQKVKRVLSK